MNALRGLKIMDSLQSLMLGVTGQWAMLCGGAAILIWVGYHIVKTMSNSDDAWMRLWPEIEPLVNYDWQSQEPRQLRPFKPTYHINMGIGFDNLSNLVIIDKEYLSRINHRKQLLASHGSDLAQCHGPGYPAVYELYGFLMKLYLPTRYPTIFTLSPSKDKVHNSVTGDTFPTTCPPLPNAALRIIGRMVEEDFYILNEVPDESSKEIGRTTHRCDAFVGCFANGFAPGQKIGLGLKDIHGPVPGYEKIGESMERFFKKLVPGKYVKRTNWGVQTNGDLYAPGNHGKEGDHVSSEDQDFDIENTYFRVELQSLMRLPQSKAIVFSLKTYLYPMSQIKAEGLGLDLADAIEGLKKGNVPGMWTYKGAERWGDRVCEYLRSPA